MEKDLRFEHRHTQDWAFLKRFYWHTLAAAPIYVVLWGGLTAVGLALAVQTVREGSVGQGIACGAAALVCLVRGFLWGWYRLRKEHKEMSTRFGKDSWESVMRFTDDAILMEDDGREMKEMRHALEKFKAEASLGEARQFLMSAKEVGGLKVLTATRSGMDANGLRQMGDFLRDKEPTVVAVLASVNGEKITFLAVCGPEAVKKGIKAGDLVRNVCAICGGKGGGKPDSAMGGGTNMLKLDDALASVDDFVASKLG